MFLKVDLRNEEGTKEKTLYFQLSDFITISGEGGFLQNVVEAYVNDIEASDNVEFRYFNIIDAQAILKENIPEDEVINDYFAYDLYRVIDKDGEPVNSKAYISLEDAINKMSTDEYVECIGGYRDGILDYHDAKDILEECFAEIDNDEE